MKFNGGAISAAPELIVSTAIHNNNGDQKQSLAPLLIPISAKLKKIPLESRG
jgi:hypothetical protein